MKTLKKSDIDFMFQPTAPVSTPERTMNRPLFSKRSLRWFVLERFSGSFVLSELEPVSVTRRKPSVPTWRRLLEFSQYEEFIDWADKADAVIELPQPADHHEILVGLYRRAFGADFDRATKVAEAPRCSQATWQYICLAFQRFDRRRHPDVLPGGLWLNAGFGVDESMPDWTVSGGALILPETPVQVSFCKSLDENGRPFRRVSAYLKYPGGFSEFVQGFFPDVKTAMEACGLRHVPLRFNRNRYTVSWETFPLTQAQVRIA